LERNQEVEERGCVLWGAAEDHNTGGRAGDCILISPNVAHAGARDPALIGGQRIAQVIGTASRVTGVNRRAARQQRMISWGTYQLAKIGADPGHVTGTPDEVATREVPDEVVARAVETT
jgi:hypothetical protein